MYKAKQQIDTDRFSGEAKEPPLFGRCSYCGGGIYRGDRYFIHEGSAVCAECCKRYAYAVFERDAYERTAEEGLT